MSDPRGSGGNGPLQERLAAPAGVAPSASGASAGADPAAECVRLDGEDGCRIHAYDRMPPFLMNIPTDTDLWMFISSAGGLTAGRRDPDGALFPYETVDRLHDAHHHTGPITLVRLRRAGRPDAVWAPFARRDGMDDHIERSLFKNVTGNQVVFEETDHASRLAFRYRWTGSDATGWVRTARLTNHASVAATVSLLDGLRNVLPSGAPVHLYQHSSCLVDAYKRVDVDVASRLGIFSLTARISDRPEPAEELHASTVWCHGLPGFRVALSLDALGAFRRGEPVRDEHLLTGRRGNYLVSATLTLEPGEHVEWHVGADSGRSHAQVTRLRAQLLEPGAMGAWIAGALRGAGEGLRRIVGSADGIQLNARDGAYAHHFANVLFNNLRGGVFVQNHAFPSPDFAAFVRARDRELARRNSGRLETMPPQQDIAQLHEDIARPAEPGLQRLALEYLPLYFGRRHGDPSRPWNRFSIAVRNRDGSQALRFEGNWRDVFQNWEALTRSFPGFLPGVIARFVNASTVDGFNPYRITRDGFEWEELDPENPWSGIGYWGDHQIVYLLKLLESIHEHRPGTLEDLLGRDVFSYADVPYRLRPYAEMLAAPRSTIRYDHARAARASARVQANGHDGRLLHSAEGAVVHVNLFEKLLVPVLAKLSSLVPDGGIWMNTERPEWNDANNALVGSGLSMVTVCHLRRHLRFLAELVANAPATTYEVSSEVATWLRTISGVLERHQAAVMGGRVDDALRKQVMDELGYAFSDYRGCVYEHGFTDRTTVATAELAGLCRIAGDWLECAIASNRRPDGLFHAYNLLEFSADGERAAIRRLGLMLEGQVAAISSGVLGAEETLTLVDRLFESELYSPAHDSFLLYPRADLPAFVDRNHIPEPEALAVPLVSALLAAGDTSVLERDGAGVLRFHADLGNARDLDAALARLARNEPWPHAVERDRTAMLALYEDTFRHRTFTGRSGTMYAYEGLGCVYWHMVAKLLLAVQEVALRAYDEDEDPTVLPELARAYYRIRSGLGFEKTARDYGAFPSDPYSHTPAHAGAQQPGMTGQVKEEILTRLGELGVRVRDGRVSFEPVLLRRDEFLAAPGTFRYFDLAGVPRSLEVPANGLAFTFCAVPVVYTLTRGGPWLRLIGDDGGPTVREDARLDDHDSRTLFARRGGIARIEVGVPEGVLSQA